MVVRSIIACVMAVRREFRTHARTSHEAGARAIGCFLPQIERHGCPSSVPFLNFEFDSILIFVVWLVHGDDGSR